MQAENVSTAIQNVSSPIQDASSLYSQIDFWALIVNIGLLLATTIYVWFTYKLWRAALSNQKELIENQAKLSILDQYFTLRRTWRSIDFIRSRNKAYKIWQDMPKTFTDDMSVFINSLPDEEAWESFSLIAHFMADVRIENMRKNITTDEMREGFTEFRWWAPRLQRLFATIPGEERMVKILADIEEIMPQTDADRAKLKGQFGDRPS